MLDIKHKKEHNQNIEQNRNIKTFCEVVMELEFSVEDLLGLIGIIACSIVMWGIGSMFG